MSQLSRAALQSEITTLIHDNATRDITPAQLRGLLTDLNDSLGNLTSDTLVQTAAMNTAIAAAVAALVNAAPGALDTLKELADALGDDANFATTIASQIAAKSNAASPVFTGPETHNGATINPAAAMGALVVDVTKALNTKSIAVDSTLTFSGTPGSSNQSFGLRIKNTDTVAHTITIPTTFDMGTQANVTAFTILPGGTESIVWQYDGTAYIGFNLPGVGESAPVTVASAGTTDIGTATSQNVIISGTTTITSLGTAPAGTRRMGRFSGVLTLTHNGTSLILPTGANITTAAGDTFLAMSEGAGNWRVMVYQRANGQPLAGGGGGVVDGAGGGTGVANTGKTITLGGNLATSGAYNLVCTLTADTNVTFPASGTLATTAQLPLANTINTITGDYTLVLTDQTKTIDSNASVAHSITVPATVGVNYPIGTIIPVNQRGAGLASFVAAGGVTLIGPLTSPGPGASMALLKIASDTWQIFGTESETLNDQSGSYTLVLADGDKLARNFIRMTSGSANNLTVPLNASVPFPLMTEIRGMQYGAGLTTFVATGGVNIRSRGAALNSAGQYAPFMLKKIATDEWLLVGDTST